MKVGVFIGRFQPLHDGHRDIINTMIRDCDKAIVLIGSVNADLSFRNPWTYSARKEKLVNLYADKIIIMPLNDHTYSDSDWKKEVLQAIASKTTDDDAIFLYGHTKEGNDYLKMFDFNYVEVINNYVVNATEIREQLYAEDKLPAKATEERRYVEWERKLFYNYPFMDTLQFVTVDALVINNGKVLLIKRKYKPGAGTYALPGGFKNHDETLLCAAKRELKEECDIDIDDISDKLYLGFEIFDSPKRNIENGGIPRISHVFVWIITANINIPVVADDDASEAEWIDINHAINNLDMFSDHRGIICKSTERTLYPAFLNVRY